MKICIPTETNEGLNAKVYGHFGSAPYFTLYDTGTEIVKVVANNNAEHAHGMCQPLSVIGDESVNVVICSGMGARAVQKLNAANIKALRASAGTVSQIIVKYKENALEEITPENACSQHGCH